MNMMELQAAMPGLMGGLWITFKVLFLAIIGGLALGTILALMRLSGIKILAVPAKLYVNFFRSVPLLLVLLWFYFAVPMVYNLVTGTYLTLDTAFTSCVVAFMVFEAAYFSEIVRAGIQSIGKGQVNAAKALGMTYGQTMRFIILPQAFRKMFPLLLQQSIILFQDTTLVFAIGLVDFFRASYVRGDLMGLLTPYILLAGAFYFVVSLTASTAVNHLRKRFRMA
ncbi:ABC transporter permease subunit [Moraxella osloensis]|jgi:glutamate/aspartate transport system permease protein|uniref:Glutamate/aspartate import permease protein GltK n=3 Tax=Pseudomonadota TaxID=1224 RepID=A0A0X8K5T3_FAUOS|nr:MULTISPECIES: ABC transporter permease subunit [Pseudomonadota]VWX30967.1 glutamate and aspartate transporter subunit; membrane component of ABC superfamily [Moraxellaceae bacterium 17A]GGM05488.1 amino acid ABC transporter permease [Streptomyces cinereus]AME01035.1 amino acid ABC transporter permease [Moraxella osloensis]KND22462.1 amino acid ABC transporter permease [Enhydrobacter aerosaccus]MBW4009024.1 ABC transporter permease subunit [Moraxella osloensis]